MFKGATLKNKIKLTLFINKEEPGLYYTHSSSSSLTDMSLLRNFSRCPSLMRTNGVRCYSSTLSKEMDSSSITEFLFPKLEDITQEEIIPLDNSVTKRSGKYFVNRSETGNLPVFTDYLNGGNKVVTEIKKIRGDPVQLKLDLQERLPYIKAKDWRVVPMSNKIVVRGNYCSQIKRILAANF